MENGWVLVLDTPSADATRRVGGLSLVLRLGLDAQAGGASAIVMGKGAAHLRSRLLDSRLTIPVLDRPPPAARSILVPASYLVPPRFFAGMAENPVGPGTQAPHAFDPIDVVDGASARRAEVALFATLRKPVDGWTSRWLNRSISLRLSRLLVRTPIRPNHVTIVILLIGLAGAWLASRGSYAAAVAGAMLFQAQSILDGCDGEMSRVTYRQSLLGEWLDTIADDVTSYAFFGSAALGLFRVRGHLYYLVAGVIIVIAGMVASGTQYRYLIQIGSGDLLRHPVAGTREESHLITAIRPLFKRDTFTFLTLVAAVLNLLGPLVILTAIAGIGLAANVMRVDLDIRRQARVEPLAGGSGAP
jgi:phosphatidylglycerophosphate synthase